MRRYARRSYSCCMILPTGIPTTGPRLCHMEIGGERDKEGDTWVQSFAKKSVLGSVPAHWEVEMKRVLKVLQFAVAFVCVLSLGTVVVFGQGDDEKTWDDVARLLEPRA